MTGLDPGRVRNVTALLIGRVGDLIVATPFLRSLRSRFPKAHLRLFIHSQCSEAAHLIAFPDEVRTIHRFHKAARNAGTIAALLARPTDLIVDLNPSFSRTSAALALLARAPVKLAFEKGRLDAVFSHHAAPPGEREHMLDRYARLAAELEAPFEPRLELRLGAEDERKAGEVLRELDCAGEGPRLLVHPGNFKKFDNRWPQDRFVELCRGLLSDLPARLFFLAGPGEEAPVADIVRRVGGAGRARALPPLTLGVTGALMRRMDLCVMNITGTTHLAAAVGAPTFGFYSGYTDAVWRPRGPRHSGVVSKSWESCREIAVQDALAALRGALKTGP